MIAFDYIVILLLICLYLYAVHKLLSLWIAKYSKVQLLFYAVVLMILTTITCYNIYVNNYLLSLILLVSIVSSLIIAYKELRK